MVKFPTAMEKEEGCARRKGTVGEGCLGYRSYSFLIRVGVTQVSTLSNLTVSRFVHIDVHMLDLF